MLARPKKSSYIIKKEDASRIKNSRTSKEKTDEMLKNSQLFRKNNLRENK